MGGLALTAVLSGFPWYGWPFGWGSQATLEFTEQRESSSISEAYVDLELETFNGKVAVAPWQGNKVTISVVKRVQKDWESQLEGIQIDFGERVDSEALGQVKRIWLKAEFERISIGPSPSVSLEVRVPEQKNYGLTVRTSNGAVQLENVKGRSLLIDTSNGAISLDEVQFSGIQATTSNGRIEGSLRGEDARLITSNGRIDLRLLGPGTYDLSTSNSRVKVEAERRLPVRVDVRTSNGEASWSGPDLTIQESSKTRLIGQTPDFDPSLESIDLKVKTSNGDVDIVVP